MNFRLLLTKCLNIVLIWSWGIFAPLCFGQISRFENSKNDEVISALLKQNVIPIYTLPLATSSITEGTRVDFLKSAEYDIEDTVKTFQDIKDVIKAQRKRNDAELGINNGIGFVSTIAIVGGASIATGGVGLAVAGALGTEGLSKGLQILNDTYDRDIALFITELHNTAGDREFNRALDSISQMKNGQAQETVKQLIDKVNLNIGSDLNDKDREQAKSLFYESVTNRLLKGYVDNGQRIKNLENNQNDQQKSVDELSDSVAKIQLTLVKFNDKMGNNLQILAENQAVIFDNLKFVEGQLTSIDAKTDFLVAQTFKNLNPEEKIAALRDPLLFPKLDEDKRKSEISKLETLKSAQEIRTIAGEVINGVGLLASISSELGVSKEVAVGLNQAAKIGGAAVNAAMSIMTGNYLAAVGAIFSMFSGPDIAQQRHEQVMKSLNKLLEGQDTLLKNQTKMLENQRKLLAGQQKIMEQISNLERKIDEKFEKANEDLKMILGEIYYNRKIISDIFNKDLISCQTLQNSVKIELGSFTGVKSSRTQIKATSLVEFLNSKRKNLEECFKSLEDLFYTTESPPDSPLNQFQSRLYVRSFDNENENFNYFMQKSFLPIYALHTHFFDSAEYDEQKYLVNPTTHLAGLSSKLDLSRLTPTSVNSVESFPHFRGYLKYKIHTPRLVALTQFLTQILPFLEISISKGYITTISRTEIQSVIFQAIRMVNLAIAQENLISGESLLMSSFDVLINQSQGTIVTGGIDECKNKDERTSLITKLVCLMIESPYFAKNLVNSATRNALKTQNRSALFYASLLASRDEHSVNELFALFPNSKLRMKSPELALFEIQQEIDNTFLRLEGGENSPLNIFYTMISGKTFNKDSIEGRTSDQVAVLKVAIAKFRALTSTDFSREEVENRVVEILSAISHIPNSNPHESSGIVAILDTLKYSANYLGSKIRELYPTVVARESRWYVEFGKGLEFLLPSLTEMNMGGILHTSDTDSLLRARESLQVIYDESLLSESLSPEDSGILSHFIMKKVQSDFENKNAGKK